MGLPDFDDIEKWGGRIKKHGLPQFFDFFFKKPSINKQFQEILQDIQNKKSPVIIADKIGTAIQQKFEDLQSQMSPTDYYTFCTGVISSIQEHLETTIYVWHDKIVNFKDVKEIWVACEPMLDLITAPDGTLELLIKQINQVEKVVYFLSQKSYFDDLVQLLQSKGVEISKLEFKKLPNKYDTPIVIYISDFSQGMTGKHHPKMKKNKESEYKLDRKLDSDWMQVMSADFVNLHITKLKKF